MDAQIAYHDLVVIVTVWVVGLRMVTDEGKILFVIRRFFLRFPTIIRNPIVTCVTCMPSLHGLILTAMYCLYYGMWPGLLAFIAIWIGAAVTSSFWVTIFWLLYQKLDKLKV